MSFFFVFYWIFKSLLWNICWILVCFHKWNFQLFILKLTHFNPGANHFFLSTWESPHHNNSTSCHVGQIGSVAGQIDSPDTNNQVVYGLVAQESRSEVGEILPSGLLEGHQNRCQPVRLGRSPRPPCQCRGPWMPQESYHTIKIQELRVTWLLLQCWTFLLDKDIVKQCHDSGLYPPGSNQKPSWGKKCTGFCSENKLTFQSCPSFTFQV